MCARGMCVYTAACCRGALSARPCSLLVSFVSWSSLAHTCATRSLRPIHLILNTSLISYMSRSLALDIGTWNALPQVLFLETAPRCPTAGKKENILRRGSWMSTACCSDMASDCPQMSLTQQRQQPESQAEHEGPCGG
ncbi:uncharacterized protein IWZ02DRAFT_265236 [Phyllosticta citriasiana]|uniref:uncharacterized protein n=1 Tax=Phyllosticta citriasiana TaxID=595635 RepID=UPI0030FDC609